MTVTIQSKNNTLIRLPKILEQVPVGKSTWWAGVKSGRFPKPIKIGPRTTAWREADIHALLESLAQEAGVDVGIG